MIQMGATASNLSEYHSSMKYPTRARDYLALRFSSEINPVFQKRLL